jgi:uncharacterized protein
MALQNGSKNHLIEAMIAYMTECMSGHDPSHNPAHVHRVVALAHRILEAENKRHPERSSLYDRTVVTLGALLHDIGDRKYLPAGDSANSIDPKTIVHDVLLSKGADSALAERVQTIVSNVSYSNEIKDPAKIRRLIFEDGYQELAIVQDADRLDALGAVGIGRCFTFLGAQGNKRQKHDQQTQQRWEMDQSIEHFSDKLEKLEGMMKTDTGKEMARERTRRLKEFKSWWEEETGMTV